MVNAIFDYEVVADTRCKRPRYVVYLIGKWDYHLMDWAGCNFRRIKAPNQPKFIKITDAINWAEKLFKEQDKKEEEWKRKHPGQGYMTFNVDGEGQHVTPGIDEVWRAKLVAEKSAEIRHKWRVTNTELTQGQWEELKRSVQRIKAKELP